MPQNNNKALMVFSCILIGHVKEILRVEGLKVNIDVYDGREKYYLYFVYNTRI